MSALADYRIRGATVTASQPLPAPRSPAAEPSLIVRIEPAGEAFAHPEMPSEWNEQSAAHEIARILRELADRIYDDTSGVADLSWTWRPLRDVNGNTCGEAVLA